MDFYFGRKIIFERQLLNFYDLSKKLIIKFIIFLSPLNSFVVVLSLSMCFYLTNDYFVSFDKDRKRES